MWLRPNQRLATRQERPSAASVFDVSRGVAETRREGVFLRVSAAPRDGFTSNLHLVHLHFGRGPYPAAHEIEDVRNPSFDRPRRMSIERIEDGNGTDDHQRRRRHLPVS